MQVEVKRTVPREEMTTKDGPKTRKIFIGGLPPSLTEGRCLLKMKYLYILLILRRCKLSDELKDHFSSYGKVVEHQIMLDHSTGRSRGFGFVTFESEDAVERVISEGRMRDLGGKQVRFFLLCLCCNLCSSSRSSCCGPVTDLIFFLQLYFYKGAKKRRIDSCSYAKDHFFF